MTETTSSPHEEKTTKPKNVGAPPAAKEPTAKGVAERLQEERKQQVAEEKDSGGLLKRRLNVSKKPGELYYLRCPNCNGEGAYFKLWPAGRVMGPEDWFTTYKGENEPWTWTMIPCQECWDRGALVPLRVEGWMPDMAIGRPQTPMFLITGKWTRFIATRSQIAKIKRINAAERNAISSRIAAIEEAKKEAARG